MAADWIEIEIVNWEKYNPRSDRAKHSWFRLQNDIVAEPKFHGLSCAQRFIAVCLFAEVSKSGGGRAQIKISWLADNLKVKPIEIHKTIQVLVSDGVLRLPPDTSNTHNFQSSLTTNVTNVTNERTNDTDTTDTRRRSATALPELVELWNSNSGPLAKVKECRAQRLKHASTRWSENPDPVFWTQIIQRIARSPFCCGDNDRRWKADFDWLIKPETAGKVLEGKYDARSGPVVVALDPERKREADAFDAEMAKAMKQLEVKL